MRMQPTQVPLPLCIQEKHQGHWFWYYCSACKTEFYTDLKRHTQTEDHILNQLKGGD